MLLSPPRLHHQSLLADPRYGQKYAADFAHAQQLHASGNGQDLMQIKFPQPLTISANTFLDKYGSSNRYDYLSWAEYVADANWIFGEQEVRGTRMNFSNCDQLLLERIGLDRREQLHVVPDADHNYTNARAELSNIISRIAAAN